MWRAKPSRQSYDQTGKPYATFIFVFLAEAETDTKIPEMNTEVHIVRTKYKAKRDAKVCQNFKTG